MKRFVIAAACFGPAMLIAAGVLPASPIQVNPLVEVRQCGEPRRDAKGVIIRRSDVLTAFTKAHPCPATGLSTGACPGWQRNHIIPLAAGGCDMVANLQWLPNPIKTCATPWCVDRWERTYWGDPYGIVTFP